MHDVPMSPPILGAAETAAPRAVIPQPEPMPGSPAESAPSARFGPAVVWLVICAGVMWAALPIAIITAVVLYGAEGPGILGDGDSVLLAILVAAAAYLTTSVLPVLAGRWAFPRHKVALTILGLLTPAVGLGLWALSFSSR